MMGAMRDLAVLFLHLLATVARLARPGGTRPVVAESVLVKQQLLILIRSRKRSPNLRLADRLVAGVCTLLMRVVSNNSIDVRQAESERPGGGAGGSSPPERLRSVPF